MKTTHVLRTDGGGSLGLGHVVRCLTIAEAIRERGGFPEIALGYSDQQTCSRIEKAGLPFRRLNPAKMFEHNHIMGESRIAIFDFSHLNTRSHLEQTARIFAALNQSGGKSLLIDGRGQDCLSALSIMAVDALVIPYAGAEEQEVLPGAKVDVRGVGYFVLDKAFLKHPATASVQPPIAKQILVTAGGSDPHDLTLFFLKVLEKITYPVQVRVVVGPSFSPHLIESILHATPRTKHPTTLVRIPETLAPEIYRADLALSASGLTKYELAYSGTPSLLISIDANHAEANLPFNKLGACHDAGQLDMATVDSVANVVEELISNKKRRHQLAVAGAAAIDGQGTGRLLDLING